jgi:hypothetical protein
MQNAGVWARKVAPFALLWLVLHVAVLAIIAFAWGTAVVVKAVLGWLMHFVVLAVLALTGAWLAMRLWKSIHSQQAL